MHIFQIINYVILLFENNYSPQARWISVNKNLGLGFYSPDIQLAYGEQSKTSDSNDQNQFGDQRFSLKQWCAGGAESRGLRKPGFGHFFLICITIYENSIMYVRQFQAIL